MTDKKKGRPSKKDLAATDQMSKREQAEVMKSFRQRMLLNPDSPKVIESIYRAALDDDHKNQAVAWKLLMDRMAPVAGFSAENRHTPAVAITISGIGDDVKDITPTVSSDDVEDGIILGDVDNE